MTTTDLQAIIALLDFNKAFDSISHDTIRQGLVALGAPVQLLNVILGMLSDSTTRVLVNGRLGSQIQIQRGTKQGDPISPVLFVIGLELLNKALNASNMKGFNLGQQHSLKLICR
jgi:hypothetical protein